MVRTEALFSQLVFDHAIRVRVNTASAQLEKKDDKKKEKEKKSDGDESTGSVTPPTSGTASSSASSSSTAVATEPKKSLDKEAKSQAGSLSNLLTVDLVNLADGVDTMISESVSLC